jgi:hypothetical protein
MLAAAATPISANSHASLRISTCTSVCSSAFHSGFFHQRVLFGADDEEIAQALVENDLCWYARVRASENDGERLAFCELTPPRLSDECRTATNFRHESAVSFAQAFERL